MIYLISLLTIQSFAAIISFVAGAVVVAVVLFLIFTSAKEEEKTVAKKKVYKFRGRYFFALSLTIIIVLVITLRLLPYERFLQGEPDETVTVVAMQWMWKMDKGTTDKSPAEFSGGNEITLPSNKKIRFIVTSSDVNHGFGVYNSDGVLVTQTQAMPQYNNILEHVFPEKGEYHILCMEYCGVPHGLMVGKIHVN